MTSCNLVFLSTSTQSLQALQHVQCRRAWRFVYSHSASSEELCRRTRTHFLAFLVKSLAKSLDAPYFPLDKVYLHSASCAESCRRTRTHFLAFLVNCLDKSFDAPYLSLGKKKVPFLFISAMRIHSIHCAWTCP